MNVIPQPDTERFKFWSGGFLIRLQYWPDSDSDPPEKNDKQTKHKTHTISKTQKTKPKPKT